MHYAVFVSVSFSPTSWLYTEQSNSLKTNTKLINSHEKRLKNKVLLLLLLLFFLSQLKTDNALDHTAEASLPEASLPEDMAVCAARSPLLGSG